MIQQQGGKQTAKILGGTTEPDCRTKPDLSGADYSAISRDGLLFKRGIDSRKEQLIRGKITDQRERKKKK